MFGTQGNMQQMNNYGKAFGQNYPVQMPSSIPGRIIESENDLNEQDLPPFGSIGIYPASDGSFIIRRQWNNNGQIVNKRYVLDENQPEEPKDNMTILIDKIDKLLDVLSTKEQ